MMEGFRRAALSVFGLASPDRRWILSQLPGPERNKLATMLAELDASGLPRGAELKALLNDASATTANVNVDEHTAFINKLSPQAVSEFFAKEPDWLLAVVIAHYEWRWTEEVMKGIDSVRRQRLLKQIRDVVNAVKPTTRNAVIESMAEALQRDIQVPPASADRFERLLRRIEHGGGIATRRWRKT